jgi:hypothetical protein
MRAIWLAVGAAWLLSLPALAQRLPTWTFDADKPGGAPPGFTFVLFRQPAPGTWLVRRQTAANHLVHQANPAADGYALAIAPAPVPIRDIEVVSRLRLAGGTRAGGLVWRYVDAQNYYAVVLDLSRQELFLWRVSAGNRVFLEAEDDLELDPEAWHTIKVVHDGFEIRVSIGGIRVFEEMDRRGVRPVPGQFGVLARGNAEVWFDDLRVMERKPR